MQDDWTAKSWVTSANEDGCGLPLQALPYCSFLPLADGGGEAHLGVGIGSYVLDLHQVSRAGLLAQRDGDARLAAEVEEACRAERLNPLMRCGPSAWRWLRQRLFELLGAGADAARQGRVAEALVGLDCARFCPPADVGDYTDFYASMHHATNVGRLFRPDHPLLPNYAWVPIGYHGRASSLVLSGSGVRRPSGQYKASGATPSANPGATPGANPDADVPVFGPTRQLDYEIEVAAYIGTGNALGEPIGIAEAERHIFGISLLNDWSARDIQAWEAQPLGPFLGKSFATSLAPWVLPMAALEPFRTPLTARKEAQPGPLPYLSEATQSTPSGIDLTVEVYLHTAKMRKDLLPPKRLSAANLRELHWSFAQMIAHHTSNGCNLRPGDLIATGTVSGPRDGTQGCLLELTRRGADPLRLANGERRSFLEDGDEVILRGFCERQGFPRVPLGECRGVVLAATGGV